MDKVMAKSSIDYSFYNFYQKVLAFSIYLDTDARQKKLRNLMQELMEN